MSQLHSHAKVIIKEKHRRKPTEILMLHSQSSRDIIPPASKKNLPHHLVNLSILVITEASTHFTGPRSMWEQREQRCVISQQSNSPMHHSAGARWSIQSVAHTGWKSLSVIRKVQCLHCYMYCVCVWVRAVLSDRTTGPWHLGNAVMSYRPPVPYKGEEEGEWVRRREGC